MSKKIKYPEGASEHAKMVYRNTIVGDTAVVNEQGEHVAMIEQNQATGKLEVSFEHIDYSDEDALQGSNQFYVRVPHPETGETIRLKRNQENGSISNDL